ncbi:rhomboid family intramembrane serine protease [Porphyromonas endodontalis]|uniref:rhomboid family intramembrane serine protease n=1 Tax=Porphyromonas endodontalis TaxID=28124 RepID=UPI0026E9289F|nr:rhomboid family intramembrane serine protease [Porphyromonas endodontalis]
MNAYEHLKQRIPPVTLNLILINLLIWLAQIVFLRLGFDLSQVLGLKYYAADSFYPFQLFTYAFLHDTSSLAHIIFNMFSLFMFGGAVEQRMGSWRYLFFYVVCLLVAGVCQEIFWFTELHDVVSSGAEMINLNGVQTLPLRSFLNLFVTIGASGAVFGLLLAFGMLFPNVPMYLFFIPIPIKAKYMVIGYGLLELFLGISSYGDGVAHYAHLGGMLGGLVLLLIWRKKGVVR